MSVLPKVATGGNRERDSPNHHQDSGDSSSGHHCVVVKRLFDCDKPAEQRTNPLTFSSYKWCQESMSSGGVQCSYACDFVLNVLNSLLQFS